MREKLSEALVAGLSYQQAELFLAHCFDNRYPWLEIWSALCPPEVLTARIPSAGASPQGKHFLKLLRGKGANEKAPFVIATHSPCGWFTDREEGDAHAHGKSVVDFLVKAGMAALNIHFALVGGKLAVTVYDPSNALELNTVVRLVVEAAMNFNGIEIDLDKCQEVPTPEIIIADEIYGPPAGAALVVHAELVVTRSLRIATLLNSDAPLLVRLVPTFYHHVA